MARDDRALAQAFGTRGAHVLVSEDVEQARPHLSQIHGEARGREGRGRQNQTPQILEGVVDERNVTTGREDASGHDVGEEKDQHDAEEEARKGHAHQGHARRQEIDDGVAFDRREDADRQGEGHRDQDRGGTQLDRRGEPFGDCLEDALPRLERTPEIALHDVREPGHVLDRKRLVEPELLADRGQHGRVGLLPSDDDGRIRRGQSGEREDDDGDEKRNGDHEQKATEDVCDHSVASALTRL